MNLIILFFGAVILAGALFAVSSVFEGRRRINFIDNDADVEPDEPTGPAKDL
ncbi:MULTISPECIES: hypothetical protein [unclassified Brevundimonas]|uniref:hypothetical protein n=1 Tax=unclassified Brevundimonas TaxID=2622653 RepID=UPI002004C127|nr:MULTISPECIES: hypothetical protein [unclassified Brevundimonas]MCK6102835.1 hypothetical protein [Brevundimonas sp. EYE_349]